jgi:hypothetical protein
MYGDGLALSGDSESQNSLGPLTSCSPCSNRSIVYFGANFGEPYRSAPRHVQRHSLRPGLSRRGDVDFRAAGERGLVIARAPDADSPIHHDREYQRLSQRQRCHERHKRVVQRRVVRLGHCDGALSMRIRPLRATSCSTSRLTTRPASWSRGASAPIRRPTGGHSWIDRLDPVETVSRARDWEEILAWRGARLRWCNLG